MPSFSFQQLYVLILSKPLSRYEPFLRGMENKFNYASDLSDRLGSLAYTNMKLSKIPSTVQRSGCFARLIVGRNKIRCSSEVMKRDRFASK